MIVPFAMVATATGGAAQLAPLLTSDQSPAEPPPAAPPRPATTRTPPPPSPALTVFASGCAAAMVRSGLTFAPGPEPAAPPVEYQQPFSASHICQVPAVTTDCGLDGQKAMFWY